MTVSEVRFCFMPERGTKDAVSILRMMQEEYHGKGKKLYMCPVGLAKAFDKVSRNVLEWLMRKK